MVASPSKTGVAHRHCQFRFASKGATALRARWLQRQASTMRAVDHQEVEPPVSNKKEEKREAEYGVGR